MQLGRFELSIISDGKMWLDGGAMFGIVPKTLWNKLNPADESNRIELALNCLLIKTPQKNVLIDTGVGTKLKERFIEIYNIQKATSLVAALNKIGLQPENIDFVINTHLHFDHCGGNTIEQGGKFVPTFPKAKYIIQKQEWLDALNPNERTKASYLKENFLPLEEAGQLKLVNGDYEILPGIRIFVTSGHTRGHQSALIESEGKHAIYFGDLIPTSAHIKIPYVMGYDLYPLDVIEEKKKILTHAIKENWLLIFEHDPKIVFAHLIEEDGKPVLKLLENKL